MFWQLALLIALTIVVIVMVMAGIVILALAAERKLREATHESYLQALHVTLYRFTHPRSWSTCIIDIQS